MVGIVVSHFGHGRRVGGKGNREHSHPQYNRGPLQVSS